MDYQSRSRTAKIFEYIFISTFCTHKMPAVPAGYQQGQVGKIRCWDRVKIGFAMGFTVGMVSGIVFGGFTALRYGLRGRELLSTVGKSVVSAGGTFGTFMAIGAAIRC
ncbi:unnamed protein product [Didymodactylos carnosus]|uniref:Reactive oxygen species modulator 1 n=1 Tax=Didymodactylos carnosus TaxID=1234261 RepID=A0A813NKE4_9BILA|nr:unnamed protein product [Didymodactylos carnosus]CAF0811588.1 unnamed protein product [Didymodactylos carnosus]CAF3518261.1 unnamed protein product [Didymodactylos carnosus]CAF3595454.1 unnamed protein product [Didymodactylos carnosus]